MPHASPTVLAFLDGCVTALPRASAGPGHQGREPPHQTRPPFKIETRLWIVNCAPWILSTSAVHVKDRLDSGFERYATDGR